jgi:hypothetical protein
MRGRLTLLPWALLAACGHDASPALIEEDAAIVSVPAPAPPPEPPAPPPEPTVVAQTRAWAVFVDDELDQCIEHTRRFEVPAGVDFSPGPVAEIDPIPEGHVIELPGGCAASFDGRTVLARCESTVDHDATLESLPHGVTMLESFSTQNFRFTSALRTDARLEACLASGQHWSAVADDSPDYVRARSRARERRMDAHR